MSSRPTALEALAERPAASALVLDFDGVLSPIVDDPATSALPEPVAASLGRLAGPLGLLAVISGRPVRFLEDRVRVPGIPLLGSYGMEQSWDGERQIDPDAKNWLHQVRAVTQELKVQFAADPGVRVEEKSVSVAVHWRQAPDHPAAARRVHAVAARAAAETGLRLEPGKLVEELRPPVEMDKGAAIARLLSGRDDLRVFAYAGDDLGDLPALSVVRAKGGYALVVDHGPETDPRLLGLADETFPGPDAFGAWLGRLADAVSGSGTPHPGR
jgi:trehalose 6-phosphate phosphatase